MSWTRAHGHCEAADVSVLGVLALAALAGWLYLALGHGAFWRTGPGLPEGADPPGWPRVVAVVPARDEAAVLPETLPTLLAQEYPGHFGVIVVDDGSTDGTADVAARLGGGLSDGLGGLRVVEAGERPPGWAGKVWAMSRGVQAAGEPEYLLFTDADIAYAPGTVTRLVRVATAERRDLVSQMATLSTHTRWERLIVPAFVYFFAQLYPFRRVTRDGARTAAAAGGCMLVRRETLARAGGLAAIRGALIDDVALGRLLKRAGGRCRLDLSRDVVSRRPYPRLADLWTMVARSAYHQLRYSPALLAGTIAALLLIYAVPPVAAVTGWAGLALGARHAAVPAAVGLLAWTIMAATYAPVLRFYRLSALRAPALPLVALMYAAMTADSARRHRAGRGGAWKGRTAAPQESRTTGS
ncbi:glycosyltransferase [Actinomadura livida]|uniref:Glycosyltransferase n=1 Tax=Actinomadura livida TaxID=79909 RepID=A0A7W7MX66_9ACTN|nr:MULTISPECIES: glycosyltransferase [Actinomadura]MBB4773495.1 hopene-associated glycosyltransferase HpnB [Actinomadura catellatispora]GGU08640.1 glycosyl transferase family 2 [Actinomadura livida]